MDHEALAHWFKGYVLLSIKGRHLERLLNRMMRQRFEVWNVVPLSAEEVQLCLAVADFFRLRLLLKETSCRVRILKKVGLPFALKQMGKNIGFYGGAVLFALLLYIGSSMIWTVDIEGITQPEQKEEVRAILADLGVAPFKFKQVAATPDEVKRAVMNQLEEATWVGFEYDGTAARLKVVLKALPESPKAVPYGNLVAKKKAVVRNFLVESGTAMVKPHQLVRPGDILVRGELSSGENNKRVPAKGEVWGEVWYIGEISVPLEQKRTVLTGLQQKNYYLQVGPFHIKIWGFKEPPFEEFSRSSEEHRLSIRSYTLPLAIIEENIMEADQVTQKLGKDQALDLGIRLAREKIMAQLEEGAEIVDENILKKEFDNGKVYIKIHYSVLEEITKRN
jgi:similar to stage IV sporulation protein